jgi:hypothetical protein
VFLLRHSPLRAVADPKSPLSAAMFALRRLVNQFINGLGAHAERLRKIDGTTPSNDPREISYRYPFIVDGRDVAPGDYEEWDKYQGNIADARVAVEELLKQVGKELSAFSRGTR